MTQRAALLEALAGTPADVTRLVRGLDEAAATWPPEGGQSCRQIVAHMAFAEPLHLARLQRVLAEPRPVVGALPFEPAADDNSPLAELARRFAQARAETLAVLRALGPAEWQRPALTTTGARTTLRQLVQDLVAHDIAHSARLAALRGQLARRGQWAAEP